jgi:glycosyltransferase involved in cell wall biosynthesis
VADDRARQELDDKTLEIVFVSSSDPLDVRSFSGTLLYMVEGLRARFPDMEVIRQSRPGWYHKMHRRIRLWSKGTADPYYWRPLNRLFAKMLARRWKGRRVLVICAVNAPMGAELSRLGVPVINVTDTTFVLMRNFYQNFAAFDEATGKIAEQYERDSIQLGVHTSFSSQWAADSAIHDYGGSPDRVSAISWGCNMPSVAVDQMLTFDTAGPCRLLFLGAEWLRKGGDVVCETARLLHERGVPVQVDIVGSGPPDGKLPDVPYITGHGFLSKADPAQFAALRGMIQRAAFLFLPTRQDCTPMVFAEANSYGTPAVTRAVGGVGDVVRDGENGYALPQPATAADFADLIERAWRDPSSYLALRHAARTTYEQRLNWSAWADSMATVIEKLEDQKLI